MIQKFKQEFDEEFDEEFDRLNPWANNEIIIYVNNEWYFTYDNENVSWFPI